MTPFRGRETTSVIKKELYQEEAICESIATTESVHTALHWRNDRDAYDISIVHGWTIGMPMTSPSFTVGRQGCLRHLHHPGLDDRDARISIIHIWTTGMLEDCRDAVRRTRDCSISIQSYIL